MDSIINFFVEGTFTILKWSWIYWRWFIIFFVSFWTSLFILGLTIVPIVTSPFVFYKFITKKLNSSGLRAYLLSLLVHNLMLIAGGFVLYKLLYEFLVNNFLLNNITATGSGFILATVGLILALWIKDLDQRHLFWYLFEDEYD